MAITIDKAIQEFSNFNGYQGNPPTNEDEFKNLIMKYLCAIKDLLISLLVSTIIIYAINIIAGFAGADYTFTHGETFVIWILMAILVNNCFKK